MKKLLLKGMTVVAAMFVTSCSSELVMEGYPDNIASGEEWVDVAFSISSENAQVVTRSTRGDDDTQKPKGPGYKQTVGRGSKIDMLIYAVYEKNNVENEETGLKEVRYTLLEQYGNGTIPTELEGKAAFLDKTASHKGQTIVYNPFSIEEKNANGEINNGEYSFTLRLMRGKEYTIAFWAQSSETDAYNTSNLEEVKVSYTKPDGSSYLNNDELRDAFCKSETFTLGMNGSSRDVVLTRPLAQINVGTTGADYRNIATNVNPQRWVTCSEIKLKGVANKINVVADVISSDTKDLEVTFKRDVIPAYMYYNSNNYGGKDIWNYLKEKSETKDDGDEAEGEENKITIDDEEYLFVKLNPKAENETETTFLGYTETYPTVEEGKYLTETFKYLSMCYVLVPANKTLTDAPNYDAPDADTNNAYTDPYASSTLTSLEVSFAEQETGNAAFPPVKLTEVPVHRNWRTNIIGGLYDKNVPTDEDPDDPHSVFKLPVIWVDRDPAFDGDYNNQYDSNNPDNVTWTENPNQSDEGEAGEEPEDQNND